MKSRIVAACLLLIGASAVVPLWATGEMTGGYTNRSVIALTLPPEDEPAETAVEEQPETAAESPVGSEPGAAQAEAGQAVAAPPPDDSPPAREAVSTQYASRQPAAEPVPAERSWWKGVMHKLGFGADPNPGETVQPAAGGTGVDADYVIGPGDQIGISVWRDENLTRTVIVLPDGKIYFPLIGEVAAGGKTVAQLKEELEKKLSRYVSDTGVTVDVRQSNSMIIYVVGKVNAPGRQILLANTNVLQALAMVGGLNPFADKDDIKIFRQEDGKTVVFKFDYDDVSEGRHLETNIALKRGDVIIVP